MKINFSKYQGAGNDFIMVDNRNNEFPDKDIQLISRLCHRRFGIGADGLILIEEDKELDFLMRYFNSDGKEASMCGNGGRCAVEFANSLAMVADHCIFRTFDGIHEANRENELINLQMNPVKGISKIDNNYLLDSGSPHLVIFRNNINDLNILAEGSKLRYDTAISEAGVNVNFCELLDENSLKIRTYERGVEGETLSCGTGSVAAAIAASVYQERKEKKLAYEIRAKGGLLKVSFSVKENNQFENIYLLGPAAFVFDGEVEIG